MRPISLSCKLVSLQDQETPKLGRKILRELSFKAVKLRSAAMLPEPSFGSVGPDQCSPIPF